MRYALSFTKQFFAVLPVIFLSCGSTSKGKEMLPIIRTVYASHSVKDSFDINVTLPLGYDSASQPFQVVYYLDANLRSGTALRSIINEFAKNNQAI